MNACAHGRGGRPEQSRGADRSEEDRKARLIGAGDTGRPRRPCSGARAGLGRRLAPWRPGAWEHSAVAATGSSSVPTRDGSSVCTQVGLLGGSGCALGEVARKP